MFDRVEVVFFGDGTTIGFRFIVGFFFGIVVGVLGSNLGDIGGVQAIDPGDRIGTLCCGDRLVECGKWV